MTYSRKEVALKVSGIAVMWVCAMVTVQVLPWMFGLPTVYIHYPLHVAAYYLAWIGVACLAFPQTIQRVYITNSLRAYGVLALFMSCVFLLYAYVFSNGAVAAPEQIFSGANSADFLVGGPAYVLVKLFEIAFQQTLIVALILVLASRRNSVRYVSSVYSMLFAAAHVFLIIPLGYTLTSVFFVGAVLSGVVFPYCIMRCNNGFVITYMLHWTFYILATGGVLLYVHGMAL